MPKMPFASFRLLIPDPKTRHAEVSVGRAAVAGISKIPDFLCLYSAFRLRSGGISFAFDISKVILKGESFKQARGDFSTKRDFRGGQEWITRNRLKRAPCGRSDCVFAAPFCSGA